VHKANLGSQLSIFDTGSSARARPRPNEFNRAPSNDPPERPKRSDKGEPGKRAARACTKPTSGHNLAFLIRARPPGRALARTTRPNEFNQAPSNDPPERPKRSDKGEPGKRAARACTKPTSGHNLAFLIRARPPGRALARTTRPNEFNRAPSNDPPERPKRSDKGQPGTRAARACTKPTSGHNLAFLIRARPPGRALARTTRPNEFNRAPSNDPPERPKRSDKGEPGKRAARACTKPTSGHNLAFLIRARPPGRALARTTRPTSSPGRPQTTRPNDPPERVHTGALKRPARTTHPNDPPERPARTSSHGRPQTTRPNEFTRAPERPKRTDKGEPGKRAARTCTKPTSGHNLAFLIRPSPERPTRTSSPGRPQTTRPNDPPERVQTGALKRPTRTTRPNDPPERVHTGALKRPARTSSHGRPQTTRPNDPPERPARTSSHGCPQTTRPNERPKRTDKGEPGKRAARTCTKPTSGHNLAFLIRARPPGRALARTTRPNEFNRAPSNDPPERPKRSDKGEPGKRAARACTKPTSGHNLAFLIRARPPGRALARTTRPNEFNRAPSNDPPERPKRSDKGEPGKRAARACIKPTSGHNLAFLIRARPPGRALARTSRPTSSPGRPQTTRPNDPPERVHTGALKRPARTTHPNDPPERPTRTTRPNEFTRAPSNDPPERVHTGARTTETNRQGRAGQTSCTNVHKANLGSQLSIFDTALARTTHPNEFTRAPSNDPPERPTRTSSDGRPQTTHPNDPPERPTRTSSHGRPQTTRPNEFTRAPSNDPPERPTRTTCPNEFTRVPSNDPPERTTETNRQGRAGQTSCTNVHKANLGSQLSIFDTALARTTRPNEFTRAPSNDPPERPARTSSPGRPQTTCPNDPPERVHTGALKRPARTTHPNDPPERPTRTSSHGRPQTTRPNDPPKRPARTSSHGRPQTTRPNDPPERPARTSSHGCPQTTRPNERPKRTDKEEPGKRAARTCTKPTSGHNLAFLIRPSPERPARTSSHGRPQTTRPNDPPERPARTSSHGRPQTTRPNEFTRAPSNDPPERPA
jgi:hypothetical protein